MIPADLLDKLREKDPELWERMRRMPIYVHRDEQLTIDLTKSDNTELVDAWLQHCLQEAIRARGWMCTVLSVPTNGHVLARIDTEGEESGTVEYGDTEAEALLRAYLQAIGD